MAAEHCLAQISDIGQEAEYQHVNLILHASLYIVSPLIEICHNFKQHFKTLGYMITVSVLKSIFSKKSLKVSQIFTLVNLLSPQSRELLYVKTLDSNGN